MESLILLNKLLMRDDCICKQQPEVFCKKGVLRNFAKFTGKDVPETFFKKAAVEFLPYHKNVI